MGGLWHCFTHISAMFRFVGHFLTTSMALKFLAIPEASRRRRSEQRGRGHGLWGGQRGHRLGQVTGTSAQVGKFWDPPWLEKSRFPNREAIDFLGFLETDTQFMDGLAVYPRGIWRGRGVVGWETYFSTRPAELFDQRKGISCDI